MHLQTPEYDSSKIRKSLISGKKLAEILNVSASTLSEAVKNGYNCGGYPVAEWAEFNEFGRVEGYRVPQFVTNSSDEEQEDRTNPAAEQPNESNHHEIPHETIVNNSYSLLPAGENYAQPVGMASFSMVLKHALGNDTPQSRAVVGGTLALLGALTAHAVSDSGVAAGIGAGAGLGIALYFYNQFPNKHTGAVITHSLLAENSQKKIRPYNKGTIQSGFLDY
jgi:hypothetical protein